VECRMLDDLAMPQLHRGHRAKLRDTLGSLRRLCGYVRQAFGQSLGSRWRLMFDLRYLFRSV